MKKFVDISKKELIPCLPNYVKLKAIFSLKYNKST